MISFIVPAPSTAIGDVGALFVESDVETVDLAPLLDAETYRCIDDLGDDPCCHEGERHDCYHRQHLFAQQRGIPIEESVCARLVDRDLSEHPEEDRADDPAYEMDPYHVERVVVVEAVFQRRGQVTEGAGGEPEHDGRLGSYAT